LKSILLVLLLLSSGCARWDGRWERAETVSPTGFQFPESRMPPDSVALEMALVQLDDSQTADFEEFWQILDQQEVELSMRQQLHLNGIRIAVMASHAPSELHQLLKPRPVEFQDLDLVGQQMAEKDLVPPQPRLVIHQRVTNRHGEIFPLQTSEIHPQFTWDVRHDTMRSVGSGNAVRGIMEIRSMPQGDGSVRLRLMPTIHHGDVKPTISVAEKSFVFDSSQTINRLNELLFDVTLRAGETVVIAPTEDVSEERSDLGNLFFGLPDVPQRKSSRLTHRVLMVRVVQTQLDDLFGNSGVQEKLATPSR
jgi:hypothetical protein